MVFVAGILIYRWYVPRNSKVHKYTQTELMRICKYVQTEDELDTMSLDMSLSDMDIDDFFFAPANKCGDTVNPVLCTLP